MGRLRWETVVVLCVWGCGGSSADPERPGGSAGSGAATGTGGTAAGGTAAGGTGGGSNHGVAGATATLWDGVPTGEIPTPEALCEQKEKTILRPCTRADFEGLLLGRWFMCSGTSPVPNDAAVGVEFASGGDWYGLLRATDGSLQRDSGFDGQGLWELLGVSDCAAQLSFNLSVGTIPAFPSFADQPRKMLLGTGGDGQQPRYVAVP